MRSFGSQSMVSPLRRVLVKRPQEAYGSATEIAKQWRALNYTEPPDFNLACQEHERFVQMMKDSGVEVLFLPEDSGTGLDSIYTHDPSIATDRGLITFRMGKEPRRGEAPAQVNAMRNWDLPVLGTVEPPGTAEGGDMVWLDHTTLVVGRGFRTNAAGIEALRKLLTPSGVTVISVDLPYWTGPADCLHLMSFISMLDDDLAVIYPRMMPVALYELLKERKIQMIEIPEEELMTQACNVLAVAPRDILMLRGNPVTVSRLKEAGCRVREFDGNEISFKGAGGPTCLTRPLLRE